MAISGLLDNFKLIDLIEYLTLQKKNGLLELHNGSQWVHILIENNKLKTLTQSFFDVVFPIRFPFVPSEEQYQKGLRRVHRYIKDGLAEAMTWQKGHFSFEERAKIIPEYYLMDQPDLLELTYACVQLVESLKECRHDIPPIDQIIEKSPDVTFGGGISKQALNIYFKMEEKMVLSEIVYTFPDSRFRLYPLLFTLLETKAIRFTGRLKKKKSTSQFKPFNPLKAKTQLNDEDEEQKKTIPVKKINQKALEKVYKFLNQLSNTPDLDDVFKSPTIDLTYYAFQRLIKHELIEEINQTIGIFIDFACKSNSKYLNESLATIERLIEYLIEEKRFDYTVQAMKKLFSLRYSAKIPKSKSGLLHDKIVTLSKFIDRNGGHKAIEELAKAFIEELIETETSGIIDRYNAELLSLWNTKQAQELLSEFLKQPTKEGPTLEGMAQYQENTYNLMLDRLEKENNPRAIRKILDILSQNMKMPLEPLFAKLDHKDWSVRMNACILLGILGNEDAVDRLVRMLEDSSKKVREEALKAIKTIKGAESIDLLMNATKDSDPMLRSKVLEMIAEFSDDKTVKKFCDVILSPAYNSGDGEDKELGQLILMVGNMGNPIAVEPLLKLLNDRRYLKTAHHGFVLGCIIGAIEKLGDRRAIPLIEPFTENSPRHVQRAAQKAIATLQEVKERAAPKPKPKIRTHYDNLNLSPSSSQGEIRRAYFKLSKKYHPDSPQGDEEKMIRITSSYKLLRDPKKRKEYDDWLRNQGVI